MHLLIDVRTSYLSDRVHLDYGLLWAKNWGKKHPHDRLTFLAYDWDPVESDNCIFLVRKSYFFGKKIAAHQHGPDRIISFSKLPPIDTSIPAILHIPDLVNKLYPAETSEFLWSYIWDYRTKKALWGARHIIVPSRITQSQLNELYGIRENMISIIPYLTPEYQESAQENTFLPSGITSWYFISECSPWNEWNPIELLRAYSRYIHQNKWTEKLILLWHLWENLGIISTVIRSLDIIEHVKIIGILTPWERESLYAHADGWIYIGHAYSRWSAISLAEAYDIPLYLSDIEELWWRKASYIHPNHIETLSDILGSVVPQIISQKTENNLIIEAYERLIAS